MLLSKQVKSVLNAYKKRDSWFLKKKLTRFGKNTEYELVFCFKLRNECATESHQGKACDKTRCNHHCVPGKNGTGFTKSIWCKNAGAKSARKRIQSRWI